MIGFMEWWVLDGVPEDEVTQIVSVARRRRFRRGEVVLHQNDPGESLHLIAKGRFAIGVSTSLGERATIAVRGPGDMFGEIALLNDNNRRSATVEALEGSETLSIDGAEFTHLRRKYPAVNEAVIRFLVDEIRTMNQRLLEAFYLPAERRVLRRVHELSLVYPGSDGGPPEIQLTQEALAEMAGTSRATVNAVLGDAQSRGLLELGRGSVRVVDDDGLSRRAR
jgi:CRP/FNR family cyclic AMP-dependent transcriptional regulator